MNATLRTALLPALLACAGPLAGQGGVPPLPPARGGQPPLGPGQHRLQLQQQVLARFMDRVTERLSLSPADRQRLEQVLARNEAQRRELAQQARAVRQQLAGAAGDPATPQPEYDRLLARMSELRARELELWQSEQKELGQVLTPRRQAQFMAMRLEFAERVQRIRERRMNVRR